MSRKASIFRRRRQLPAIRRSKWIAVGLLPLALLCLTWGSHSLQARDAGDFEWNEYEGQSFERQTYLDGFDVLCSIFDSAGHTVEVTSDFDDALKDSEIIVWAPGEFSLPDAEQQAKLTRWLSAGSNRVLVYIAHDFDAQTAYWEKLYRQNPQSAEAGEYRRRAANADLDFFESFQWASDTDQCRWFGYERKERAETGTRLSGPWSEGIVAQQCDIMLRGTLVLPGSRAAREKFSGLQGISRTLLDSNAGILAAEIRPATGGRVIAIANESFLCNLGLVNRENRKLAGKLTREIGNRQNVVFYSEWYAVAPPDDAAGEGSESDGSSPPQPNSEMSFLKAWPLNFILLHLLLLGIILCIALSPIFGRPRKLPAAETADFGRHLKALGDLLSRSGDRRYAQTLLDQFQTSQRNEGRRPTKS